MASRIAGITVEIGGDTTKLSRALESVNKTIKTTQAELKDVNKLLKLDPSNTEAVTQKQRMLKEAIEATKEKLTTLKTAAEQANQQLADGKITQDQYDALQREIVETEQNLKSLQEQAAVTNTTLAKIDAVGEKLQTVGSQVEGVGKKFLPVTAAVTGLGTAAVKTAADFDQEMSKVAAISGATGSDFDALREKAREMGAKTKFSASEAASAMEYMAMAGWKTGDMLDGIEGIMNLAAASGEDLATTSDIVTDALTAFGLSASDSGHFADILAAASSNANTNVSMMGETFKYCAPIAGALGFSAEDTAEAIGLMANSGIKASQAGTSLRSIMNNLAGEVTFARQYLSFAGKSSKDFLLYLSGPSVYDSPAADVESTSVPGRNGDIISENARAGRRRYQNVDIKYEAFFFNGLPAKTAAVKSWLLSPVGYQKLQDTYDPDFFRMAVCTEAMEFDVTAQKAARMDLVFNCKPQRWSVEGQRTVRLESRSNLMNPFAFPAQPIFKVYGDSGGVLYVGDESITIHSIKDYVLLNCETHNAYNADGFCNETILSDDFPELPAGKTQIAWTGGITAVEVTPRWWTL